MKRRNFLQTSTLGSIIGTLGKVVLEPVDSPNLTLYIGKDRAQERFDETIPLPENVHQPMIQNFIDSVMQGIDPVEVGDEIRTDDHGDRGCNPEDGEPQGEEETIDGSRKLEPLFSLLHRWRQGRQGGPGAEGHGLGR